MAQKTLSKTCRTCHERKPIAAFEEYMPGKRRGYCRSCFQQKRQDRVCGNPELFLRRLHSHLKHNRTKQGKSWALEAKDIMDLWESQGGRCALSGIKMTLLAGYGKTPTNPSLDRIDPDGPYEKGNVQLVCAQVNIMRHTLDVEDFLLWCSLIVRST